MTRYIGRFAPSPTGPLHAGSLVAALASWLDARAHGGRWLVRIEDVDAVRCRRAHEHTILAQLAALSLHADEAPIRQSERGAAYQAALDRLIEVGRAYACTCSRQTIEATLASLGRTRERHSELVYPGTCRARAPTEPVDGRAASRLRVETGVVRWTDRRMGPQQQDVEREVGDFVLRRADGLWAYQLAVVVDDAAQGITHVVRGEDLADNTPRQIALQSALGFATPRYLHTPLVLNAAGEKLSKGNGATAVDTNRPLEALRQAGHHLGIDIDAASAEASPQAWLEQAIDRWRLRPAGMMRPTDSKGCQ